MTEEEINKAISKLNAQIKQSSLHLGAILGAYKKLASEHIQVGTLFELIMEFLTDALTDDQKEELKEYVDIRFPLKHKHNKEEFLDPVLNQKDP